MKLFLACLLIMSHWAWAAPNQGVVKLRADVWCPFNCEPDAKYPGLMIEIAKIAFASIDMEVDYKTLNWARAIVETRDGKFDGIVGSAKSDAPDFIFPGEGLGISKNCFFTKPDQVWSYKGVESLSDTAFGVIKDYSYGEPVDGFVAEQAQSKGKKPGKVDIVSGDNALETNYKKLQAGRIVALIEEQSVFKSFMYKNKMDEKAVKNVGCVKEDSVYIAFGPKGPNSARYAKLLGETVQALRKDGRLKDILSHYGLVDWRND